MSFGFGVSDLLTVSQLTLQVYESCSKAPEQFAELRDQVKSLQVGLQAVATYLASNNVDPGVTPGLRLVIAGFNPILEDLSTLITKRKKLGSDGFQLWDRLRWPGNQKLTGIRSRLTAQITLLSFCLDILARYASNLTLSDPTAEL